jgi:long-subunit fatty acid transport protein
MSIGVRVGYSDVSALLITEEKIGNTTDKPILSVVSAYSNHILDASVTQINLAPYLAYYITNAFVGHIGLNIGYMMTNTYEYREEVDRPNYAIFLKENSRVRNLKPKTDIPGINPLQLGILVGIGYELPISKYSKIMPELQYNFNLNKVSDLDWRTSSLRFGAAIKFAITKPAFIEPEIFYHNILPFKVPSNIRT